MTGSRVPCGLPYIPPGIPDSTIGGHTMTPKNFQERRSFLKQGYRSLALRWPAPDAGSPDQSRACGRRVRDHRGWALTRPSSGVFLRRPGLFQRADPLPRQQRHGTTITTATVRLRQWKRTRKTRPTATGDLSYTNAQLCGDINLVYRHRPRHQCRIHHHLRSSVLPCIRRLCRVALLYNSGKLAVIANVGPAGSTVGHVRSGMAPRLPGRRWWSTCTARRSSRRAG